MTLLDEQAHDLGDEQRVALGLSIDRLDQSGRSCHSRDQLDEASHVGLCQAPHEDALEELLAGQLSKRLGEGVASGDVDVAIRADHQQPGIGQVAGQELQQQQRRAVRPVQILQNEHQRLVAGSILEKGGNRVKQPKTRLVRFQSRRRPQVGDALAEVRDNLGDIGRACAQFRSKLSWISILDVRAHCLDPWPIGRGSGSLIAATPQDLRLAQAGIGCQFLRRASLADSGLANER